MMIKLSFLILGFVIVLLLWKVQKLLFFERRIKRYSLSDNKEDISIMDNLDMKYHEFLARFEKNEKLQNRSSSYRKYITLGENENPVFFLLHKLVLAVVFTILVVLSSILSGKLVSFIGVLVSFIIGYYVYDIYLYITAKMKKKKIKNEMLRAVILMNNSFKAGKSILQSVLIVSEKLPNPISQEFKRIYQDMSYGLSADVAFLRFSNRVHLEEATFVATSLSILNKTGGNIISVFNSIEKTLFDKKKLENDLKSSSSASNLVVKFLMGIPIVFVLLIYVISPSYFEPLFSSPLGYFMLFLMWIMFIMYIYLLNKIMKVKV